MLHLIRGGLREGRGGGGGEEREFAISSDGIFNIHSTLVGSVQYTCPVVPLCIVDASLSHYVGN